MTPAGVENFVELEHGHVAADAVAVVSDGAEVGELRGARGGMEMIELGDVLPGREIGIFGEGDEARTLRRGLGKVERGIVLEFFWRGLDVEIGMLARPGMIERGVVADEIEK